VWFSWQAAANAVGTVIAIAVVYLAGVVFGIVKEANVASVLVPIAAIVVGATSLIIMARRVRAVTEDAMERMYYRGMWRASEGMAPKWREEFRAQLRKERPDFFSEE
jgi:hypothetical protein